MRYPVLSLSLFLVVPIFASSENFIFSAVESVKNNFKSFYDRISIHIGTHQNPLTGNTVITGSIGYQCGKRPIDVAWQWMSKHCENCKNLFDYHFVNALEFIDEHPRLVLLVSSQAVLLAALMIVIAKNIKLSRRLEHDTDHDCSWNNCEIYFDNYC